MCAGNDGGVPGRGAAIPLQIPFEDDYTNMDASLAFVGLFATQGTAVG